MAKFAKTFIFCSLFFGTAMALFFAFSYGWRTGLSVGPFAGLLFGALITAFILFQSYRFTKNRPLSSTETLLHEGGTNHFLNGESVGGWMYMTDQRLLFVSHGTNFQNHKLSIHRDEIASVETAKTFGIIPNQLRVILKTGQMEKFVVFGVADWAHKIESHFLKKGV